MSISGEPRAAPELVGRDDELAALHDALQAAFEHRPQLVVVEGPAGVGKSALLRTFARSIEDRATVLASSGDEAEQHLDFGLVEQLHADGEASDVPVLSMFGRSGPRPDPLDIGADIVRVASEASAFRPVVALIDDAQWADQASMLALTYAMRRFRDQRLVIIVAQRPDVPALATLAKLCQDERGTRLRLGGLAAPQLDALLRSTRGIALGEHAAQRLHDHTQGNPLEALTLADELDPEAISTGIGPLPAPRSYATLALYRLTGCHPDTEYLVAAVAVMGTPVEVGALVELLDLADVDALSGPLDEAVTGGHLVIIERAGRRMVEVAHPLLRSAVVADLAPGIRSELHARAATITDDPALGARAVTLARELLSTGWDLTAVELLSEAARVLPDGPQRAEALLLAANRLFTTGELRSARQLLAAVDGDGGALELLVRGQDLMHLGEPRQARQALKAAWDLATEPRIAGQTAGLLATLSSNAGDGSDAIGWARAALAQADTIAAEMCGPNRTELNPRGSESDGSELDGFELGGSQLGGSELGNAFVMLATGWAFEGGLDKGLAEVDESLARIGRRSDRDDAMLARGLLLMWSGRFAEADATFTKILDAGEVRGPLLTRMSAGYSRADCRYRQGAWDDALAQAEQLIAVMDAGEHDLTRPMAHGVAAFVHAGRGAVTHAEGHLADGRAAQERSDNTSGLLWLMAGEARIGAATGDHRRVVDQLGPLADMLRASELGEGVQPWRADLVEALVELGRLDEATEALAELEQRVASGGDQARIGAARARGLLAAALGDDEAAEAAFAAGLQPVPLGSHPPGKPDPGDPFLKARLQLAAGCVARRRGHRRRAAELLGGALERFDALGAEPYRRRAVAELEACGLTPRSRTDAGPTPLSPAERQVAELVAAGLTNREVAGRLHISVKTVETHVARCFSKLDVRNRTALAVRWADRATTDSSTTSDSSTKRN